MHGVPKWQTYLVPRIPHTQRAPLHPLKPPLPLLLSYIDTYNSAFTLLIHSTSSTPITRTRRGLVIIRESDLDEPLGHSPECPPLKDLDRAEPPDNPDKRHSRLGLAQGDIIKEAVLRSIRVAFTRLNIHQIKPLACIRPLEGGIPRSSMVHIGCGTASHLASLDAPLTLFPLVESPA